MTTYTTGQAVKVEYNGQSIDATVQLASANSRSLLLMFDGALLTPSGGMLLQMMPLLMDDDGVYRDLVDSGEATVTPTACSRCGKALFAGGIHTCTPPAA